MQHPNARLLEKLYADFARGDVPAVLNACDDRCTFQFPGRGRLAGKFTKADFAEKFLMPLADLTGGTLRIEVHDILASDRHGVVLASDHFSRKGTAHQLRTVHVWRFEGGRPVAWYEYPRDLHQWEEILA